MESRLDNLVRSVLLTCLIFDIHFVTAVPFAATSVGVIQGVQNTSIDGIPYFAFRGIPYAQPPVGDLRWQLPKEFPAFDSVYEAVDFKLGCPQKHYPGYGSFDEDCLYLDVYVPHNVSALFENATEAKEALRGADPVSSSSSSASALPVMVWIHGGAYHSGVGRLLDAWKLVTEQQIVVVVVQYRLGALGFLSTGDSTLPGNYGLWDQSLALRWVKDNIQGFGGNVTMVTVAGESAGSASVSQHMLSRQSSGLFRRAVMMSGTAEAAWSFNSHPRAAFDSVSLLTGCGDNKTSTTSRLNCLKTKPATDIYNAAATTENGNFVTFVPTVDGKFFPDKAENLLKDEQYLQSIGFYDTEILMGVLNNEGVVAFEIVVDMLPSVVTTGQIPYSLLDNVLLDAALGPEFEQGYGGDIKDVVNNHYFYPRDPTQTSFSVVEFFKFGTDGSFVVPAVKYVRHHSAAKSSIPRNSYLYFFDWFPSLTQGSLFQGMPHGLDVDYLFGLSNSSLILYGSIPLPGTISPVEFSVSRMYGDMIGAFIRTGNPNNGISDSVKGKWLPYDMSNETFLRFKLSPSIDHRLHSSGVSLWVDLLPRLQSRFLENSANENDSTGKLTYFDLKEHQINALLVSLIAVCAVLFVAVVIVLVVCGRTRSKRKSRSHEMGHVNDSFNGVSHRK